MLSFINRFLESESLFHITCLSLVLTGAIGFADIIMGPAISLSVFYLIPVSFSAWYGNRNLAIAMSLIASAIMIALDLPTVAAASGRFMSSWNGIAHLGFFLSTTYLVSELKIHLEAEKMLARTDMLTGAMNRRAFLEQFGMLFDLACRRSAPLTIAYIDLDNFKQTNDIYGHEIGDRVLQTVVTVIRSLCRRTDLVARIGGDEFVVVLPDTAQDAAQVLMTKVQDAVQKTTVETQSIACSIGVVTFVTMPDSVHDALRFADGLMYKVKENGKNGVAFRLFDDASVDRSATSTITR